MIPADAVDAVAYSIWGEEVGWQPEFQDKARVALERALPFLLADPRVIPSRKTDPATSHAAAAAIVVRAGSQRALLLEAFASCPGDATDEEAMEYAPNVSPHSEYAKRCSELREIGYIEPTGETRPGAAGPQRIVSRITEAGRLWLATNVTPAPSTDGGLW